MLKDMRKFINNWVAKIVLFLVAIVFLFWGANNLKSDLLDDILSVNGDSISLKEYKLAYDSIVTNLGEKIYEDGVDKGVLVDRLKELILNRLINYKLFFQQARNIGIIVRNEEVVESIKSNLSFYQNGLFNFDFYIKKLINLGLSPEEFEKKHKDFLLVKKLIHSLSEFVIVSDLEILNLYKWSSRVINFSYASFNNNYYKKKAINSKELSFYFDQNHESYKNIFQARLGFLKFEPEDYFTPKIFTDNDILRYYEKNKMDFAIKKIASIRHILIKSNIIGRSNFQGEKIAINLNRMSENGVNFAEMIKIYSECISKKNGGKVLLVGGDSAFDIFTKNIFSMSKSEASYLIKSKFGWHIVKVDDLKENKILPLEEIRVLIKGKMDYIDADIIAYNKSNEFLESYFNKNNEYGSLRFKCLSCLKSNNGIANFDLTDLVNNPSFIDSIAHSTKETNISDIYEIDSSYFIFKVIKSSKSDFLSFEKVKSLVLSNINKYRFKTKKLLWNNQQLKNMTKNMFLEKAFDLSNIEIYRTNLLVKDLNFLHEQFDENILKDICRLSFGKKVSRTVLEGKKKFYIFKLEKRIFSKKSLVFLLEKERIQYKLFIQKRSDLFLDLLKDLRKYSKIITGNSYNNI